MLARRQLPPDLQAWNRRWHAPFGRPIRGLGRIPKLDPRALSWRYPRLTGPFGFQPNNTTRRFEYPWAFSAVDVAPGSDVIEIGGSLSGFQFVLAKAGASVLNVDPGEAASGRGWPVDSRSIDHLNRAFKTNVRLVNTVLEQAQLPSESTDIVYSISTIEHIPPQQVLALMREITRILRPGGHCVLTIDLFLNLEPFTGRTSNPYGSNVPPMSLVDASGLDLVVGEPSELLGSPDFRPEHILARLEDFLVGDYPVLAQCLVLRKPSQE